MVDRVTDTRDSASGVHECSVSFLRRPGQYTDGLRAQLWPRREVYGMPSTPETGRLVQECSISF